MLRPCMIGDVGALLVDERWRSALACWVSMARRSWLIRSTSSGCALMKSALAWSRADLSGEPGSLALEKPSVRFGCLLPGTFGCLQRGSAALETFAAAVPGEEPKAGILGTPEVLLVSSAGRLKVLVASSADELPLFGG